MQIKCNHNNISHATSSDWESVCADCGEVIMVNTFAVYRPVIVGKRLTGYRKVLSGIPNRSLAMVEVEKQEKMYGMAQKFPCKIKREPNCADCGSDLKG